MPLPQLHYCIQIFNRVSFLPLIMDEDLLPWKNSLHGSDNTIIVCWCIIPFSPSSFSGCCVISNTLSWSNMSLFSGILLFSFLWSSSTSMGISFSFLSLSLTSPPAIPPSNLLQFPMPATWPCQRLRILLQASDPPTPSKLVHVLFFTVWVSPIPKSNSFSVGGPMLPFNLFVLHQWTCLQAEQCAWRPIYPHAQFYLNSTTRTY